MHTIDKIMTSLSTSNESIVHSQPESELSDDDDVSVYTGNLKTSSSEQADSDDEQADSDDEQADSDDEQADSNDEQADSDDEQADSNEEEADSNEEEADSDEEEADSNEEEADSDDEQADSNEEEADSDEEEADSNEEQADSDEEEADSNEEQADSDEEQADSDEEEADSDEEQADSDEEEAESNEEEEAESEEDVSVYKGYLTTSSSLSQEEQFIFTELSQDNSKNLSECGTLSEEEAEFEEVVEEVVEEDINETEDKSPALESEIMEEEVESYDSNSGDEIHSMKKQLKILNQNFLILRSTMTQGIQNIKLNVQSLQDEIIDLRQHVEQSIPKSIKNSKMTDIKKNSITINREIMMKYINRPPLTADKQLFKYYYLNNKKSPIKKISPTIYEYWCDGSWHVDQRGKHIINVICYNLRKCWLRLEPRKDVHKEIFLNIQSHINKLASVEYQNKLLRCISDELPQDG